MIQIVDWGFRCDSQVDVVLWGGEEVEDGGGVGEEGEVFVVLVGQYKGGEGVDGG